MTVEPVSPCSFSRLITHTIDQDVEVPPATLIRFSKPHEASTSPTRVHPAPRSAIAISPSGAIPAQHTPFCKSLIVERESGEPLPRARIHRKIGKRRARLIVRYDQPCGALCSRTYVDAHM